jgi:hypothetical protein
MLEHPMEAWNVTAQRGKTAYCRRIPSWAVRSFVCGARMGLVSFGWLDDRAVIAKDAHSVTAVTTYRSASLSFETKRFSNRFKGKCCQTYQVRIPGSAACCSALFNHDEVRTEGVLRHQF